MSSIVSNNTIFSLQKFSVPFFFFFFFLNDAAPTEISPLPLHDALPICGAARITALGDTEERDGDDRDRDRNIEKKDRPPREALHEPSSHDRTDCRRDRGPSRQIGRAHV